MTAVLVVQHARMENFSLPLPAVRPKMRALMRRSMSLPVPMSASYKSDQSSAVKPFILDNALVASDPWEALASGSFLCEPVPTHHS